MHERLTKLKAEFVVKKWGHEEIFVSNAEYCGKILHINKGKKLSSHAHRDKRESWRVLTGCVKVTGIDTRTTTPYELFLKRGEILDIERLCFHQVEAIEDADILEVSTRDEPWDNIKIISGSSQE